MFAIYVKHVNIMFFLDAIKVAKFDLPYVLLSSSVHISS